MTNNSKSLAELVSGQSSKLNDILDKLDSKLKDAIAKLPVEKQIELYDKLNKQYNEKLGGKNVGQR